MNNTFIKCPSYEFKKLPKNEEAIRKKMVKVMQSYFGIHPSYLSGRHTSITAVTVIGFIFAIFVFFFLLYKVSSNFM